MPVEILPDFFFIERGYLNANHFAYRAAAPVLIDTGYIADFAQTRTLLTSIGIALEQIGLIVTTHCHCDHVGGNRLLQELSGCGIALHPLGKRFMEERDDRSTWWRYYRQEAEFFTATQTLADGQAIEIGPHRFEVIHTPGHSADGIALVNRKEKLLLSSDALWEKDMAVMTLKVEGEGALDAMLASLERIALLDVQIVYPGHGAPFTDVQAALARSRDRLKRFMAHTDQAGYDLLKKIIVYTLLMHRGAAEETFFQHLMSTEWFPDTVKACFEGRYQDLYDMVIAELVRKKVVVRKKGMLAATVKP
jgi:hydroxyacylglutathione hydrolase